MSRCGVKINIHHLLAYQAKVINKFTRQPKQQYNTSNNNEKKMKLDEILYGSWFVI